MGYEPIPVSKAAEAVAHYDQWAPDAVLMDRSMPGMDGITCIREIVKSDSGAKIIIISGYGESGPHGIQEDVGGLIKGYLTKPCSLEDLSSTLARVLGP
jgi:two-component system chemotaxis response regulator CheY